MSEQRLRTVIADDESLARQLLRMLLLENPAIDLVAECKNGRETIEAVNNLKPDLLFLDIQMPGISGFDVVQELQSDNMPMVIFCTAHQRFAVEIFDRYGVDYLLKPMEDTLVLRTVQRACASYRYSDDIQHHTSVLIKAVDEINGLLKMLDTDTVNVKVSTGAKEPVAKDSSWRRFTPWNKRVD
jgi:two-component system LytT family response regulator